MIKKIYFIILLFFFSTALQAFDNYYQILGIQSNATPEEIKSAYRKMAMKYHPDRNGGSLDSAKKFVQAKEAYDILSDPIKKSNFDFLLRKQPKPNRPRPSESSSSYSKPNYTKPDTSKAEKYTWQDFGAKKPDPKPEAPKPKPEEPVYKKPEVKPEVKPEPKPEPVKAEIKVPVKEPPLVKPNPEINAKLKAYGGNSCQKGFLGTVLDVMI